MDLAKDRMELLFQKYFEKTATDEERSELAELIQNSNEPAVMKMLSETWDLYNGAEQIFDPKRSEEIIGNILHKNPPAKVIVIRSPAKAKWRWVVSIAAVFIIAVGSYFLFIRQPDKIAIAVNQPLPNDVPAPQSNKATITLANGEKIYLDSSASGKLGTQGATIITKNASGEVVYQSNGADYTQNEFNTLTNPKGSKVVSLTLSDGTQVWLNAESSITYPAAFAGNERNVSITGEAYFEVAHNASKPFHVNVKGMDVQVLGTHFNINSYSDEESVKTTLLQGSIKITSGGKVQMVKPGEQTEVSRSGEIRLIKDADLNAAVAWKNGFFQFNGIGIETVMRQLVRWYDIDVKYEGKIPNRQFAGQIDRSATLSQVLKILQESNVHFTLNNRTVVVTP